MKAILNSLRVYIFRGMLAVTPLGLTFLILRFLYRVIDHSVIGQFDHAFGMTIPGPWVGIVVFLALLYAIGIIASNVIGRQVFNLIDNITERIPVVKAIYQIGKQLSATLSPSGSQAFQRVVFVDYFHPGIFNIGFVTGSMTDRQTGEEILKVLIPTVPNPATGFVVFVKPAQTIDPKWSVEEGLKIVISGGIIGPNQVK